MVSNQGALSDGGKRDEERGFDWWVVWNCVSWDGLLQLLSVNTCIHSLVNATTLQELNVEVRGTRHLSVHNLKRKRETNRMKWVRVSLSVCYFSSANFFVRD